MCNTDGRAETRERARMWCRLTTWSLPLSPTITKIERCCVWTVLRISAGIRESSAFFGIAHAVPSGLWTVAAKNLVIDRQQRSHTGFMKRGPWGACGLGDMRSVLGGMLD